MNILQNKQVRRYSPARQAIVQTDLSRLQLLLLRVIGGGQAIGGYLVVRSGRIDSDFCLLEGQPC